jgi:predicted ester cyclase
MTHEEQSNVSSIKALYEHVLEAGHLDLLPSLVADNVVFHPGSGKGLPAYKAVIDRLQTGFSERRFSLEDFIAVGDRVAVRWTMDAIHSGPIAGIAATGKRVQQHANVIFRFEQGKIAEVWTQMDQIGMLRQLGIDPLSAVSVRQANAEATQ